MVLEICASSFQSAINAQNAGAHRIELCSELAVGGVTPSYGLLKNVLATVNIPVNVLIRPRSGNFTYSDEEFTIMKTDIQLCKDLGCNGIVSGVLNPDNTIDIVRTKELIEWSKPLEFTFHRAFDWIENSFEALEQLITIGATRVLTSGKKHTALEGIDYLNALKERVNNNIIILPGGGINKENAVLFKNKEFKEIHCSAAVISYQKTDEKLSMNNQKLFDDRIIVHSDSDTIKAILDSIR
jgi:copper homeostasis protein